jgi:ribosomal protein L11 methylase PrmA
MNYINNKKELSEFFNKKYFHSINYSDYIFREEKYLKTAQNLINDFKITPSDNLLDYGCAVGFLISGFKKLNIHKIYGFDISEWAIDESKKKNLIVTNNLNILNDKKYKLTTVLDVFEHMFDEDVDTVLNILNTELLVVRIPVKLKDENDFYLEVSRKDLSHVNCKTKEEWINKIEGFNFKYEHEIQNESIFDSPGVFCGYFKKII